MKYFLFLLLIVQGLANYTALSYVDRQCGQDLSNLWVDVVVVVDNSAHMTNVMLAQVAANLATVFSAGTRIGTDSLEPRTTRVALVTYNSNATTVADLNKFQNLDDLLNGLSLIKTSQSNDSNLDAGLWKAWQVFQEGSQNSTRLNYRNVIIVYTDYYDTNYGTVHLATQLKSSGVTIITVAIPNSQDPDLEKYLTMVASRGLNFKMNDVNLSADIQQGLLDGED